MKKVAVIMAGGFGERFWPLSRMKKPKQILKLTSDNLNMMQESISRISEIISYDDIFIITSELILEPIRNSVPEIPAQNIIAEPIKRNTAPCLALAASFIMAKYIDYDSSEIVMAVLTADHKIEPKAEFQNNIVELLDFVYKNPSLATIGIKPDRPDTGYGYIELGGNVSESVYSVNRFREKPDLETAISFLQSGNFVWNSGMFFWRLDTFTDELIKNSPDIGKLIPELKSCFEGFTNLALSSYKEGTKEIFELMPSISIDYALMEKSGNVVCRKSDFRWDDVGSWDSLDRVRPSDNNKNILTGNVVLVDSTNSTILNESNITVTGVGLENLVVIATDDSIMICPKEKAQDVKKIVNALRDSNKVNLL